MIDVSRFMNNRSATNPVLHPNGNDVLFLSDMSGVPEVWSVAKDGDDWPRQITFFSERVMALTYSPKGDKAVAVIDVGGNRREQFYMLSEDGSDPVALSEQDGVFRTMGPWAPDGTRFAFTSNVRSVEEMDLHIVAAGENVAAAQTVMQGGVLRPVAWSPSGERLLVLRIHTNFDQELILLDLKTGEQRSLNEQRRGSVFDRVRWTSPESFLVLSDVLNGEFRELLSYSFAEANFDSVIRLETDIDEYCIADDGEIVFIANEEGYSRLYRHRNGQSKALDVLPQGVYTGLVHGDGRLYVAVEGPRVNSNLWTVDLHSEAAKQITFASNGNVPTERLVEPELVHIAADDGIKIPVFVYAPAGGAEGAPAIVDIHGGPEGQRRPRYNAFTQHMVDQGYVVLHPNIRGSFGYGRTYVHLDDGQHRMNAFDDITRVGKWAVEELGVDGERLGLMGCSYGGYSTFLGLALERELWKAGVSVVGIASFVTMLENTAPWRRSLREAEYGNIVENTEFLRSISPITYAERIVSPVMIIHGLNDPIVPPEESTQMITRLQGRSVPMETMFLPDEGHTENHDTSFTRIANNVKVFGAIASFFHKHL